MPKVGNYVQRDYHKRFSSQGKSTWSDYNEGWNARRQKAAQKMQNLRSIASTFQNIGVQATQASTLFVMQNQNQAGPYASSTAVMSRINVLV